VRLIDFSDELHFPAIDQRLYALCEVGSLRSSDLRREFEWNPSRTSEVDRGFGTLFRRDAPEEGEIPIRIEVWDQQIFWQAVVDGACPVNVCAPANQSRQSVPRAG